MTIEELLELVNKKEDTSKFTSLSKKSIDDELNDVLGEMGDDDDAKYEAMAEELTDYGLPDKPKVKKTARKTAVRKNATKRIVKLRKAGDNGRLERAAAKKAETDAAAEPVQEAAVSAETVSENTAATAGETAAE